MIKKLQFKFELLFSYFKKNLIFFLIGTVLGSATYLVKDKLIAFDKLPIFQTQRIGIEGLYTFDTLPSQISQLISFGLTLNSENDKPQLSALVKSYDLQNNNQDYIFDLNTDLYWHDGKNFTAQDINYQISGLEISIIDSSHIKITPEKPFAPLLSILDKPLYRKKTIGLGPYRIESVSYKDGYINILNLKPIDKTQPSILYKFYPNEKDLITAYKLGDVDQIEVSTLPSEFNNWSKTKITQNIQTSKKYSAIFFNTQKLDNKQLRQALAYATPRTKDRNERCLGPIYPNSWAYNPSVKEYSFNSQRANDLAKDSGVTSITLNVLDRRLLPVAEGIKESWKSVLNIDTTIAVDNQIDLQNFDAVLAYGGIPHDPDQYAFWHSTQTQTNLTKLNNSRIDKLLEEGRQTMDVQERKRIYQDFQRYLLEESPAVFLSYPTVYTINRLP